MAHCASRDSAWVRPTLPPLHTLDLPRGKIQLPRIHELYDLDELSRQTSQLHIPSALSHDRQKRHVSISSSTTSRTPSPAPSCVPAPCLRPSTNIPTSTSYPTQKLRLVPTTFENADAVVLISPQNASHIPPPQPLLLVGPALQRLRHPQRQLAKGARLHPYRIVRGPSDPHARRPSTVPIPTKA
ncbi:hypothetical protein PAXRUDRAFT_156906 [Paxillus rubicundulus Ve08.2h10]|uniref:Uncharacterized protein n=1 Tax=Paxillus rubicundulus Ve08.2h10 TaxID=930991 RepID=A0A0D0DHW9_9AGAM|nr:hypothetical protein PAXRUDRAFT_156906 [Paxillus rubicundulus Ve08.2h10]